MQLPTDNLPNLRLLLNDSTISSLVIISFKTSRQILFQHQITGQLSSGSDVSLKKVKAFFTNNGTSTVNLFDGNLLIRSLAYDRLQKQLYLLKLVSLLVFDLTTRSWNQVQLESDLKKKIVDREGSSGSLSTHIKSILYANGQLYAQVNPGFQLIKMHANGKTVVVNGNVKYTWKELFNCYQNSPLVSGEAHPNLTTKGQSIKPLQTVYPNKGNSSQPTEQSHAVIIILVIVVALILFLAAIVYCKYL